MAQVEEHILVADIGGTNVRVAIFSHRGKGSFESVRYRTCRSRTVGNFAGLLGEFLREAGRGLKPPVTKACIDFAGPIGSDRSTAFITNLNRKFTAQEILQATGVEQLTLLNDFEAVGYGFETLISNRPEAFVRLSRAGKLPRERLRPTAALIGAGTGLGTAALVHDGASGKYRPIPGEGGHADFVPVEETEFRIAQWIRKNRNRSPDQPVDCEKVVSGPGLVNVCRALYELEPGLGRPAVFKRVLTADPYNRPAVIVSNADKDALCRKALDLWLRCYGRAAKNNAIFPLSPGGVFLAGGIAAKILPELQSGLFMKEFIRCDAPNIQAILKRMPVFVVMESRIGLYGCANVAMHFWNELGVR